MSSTLPINSRVEVMVCDPKGNIHFDMVVTEFEVGRQWQPVISDVYRLASQRQEVTLRGFVVGNVVFYDKPANPVNQQKTVGTIEEILALLGDLPGDLPKNL